jgi:hypothetical protein
MLFPGAMVLWHGVLAVDSPILREGESHLMRSFGTDGVPVPPRGSFRPSRPKTASYKEDGLKFEVVASISCSSQVPNALAEVVGLS